MKHGLAILQCALLTADPPQPESGLVKDIGKPSRSTFVLQHQVPSIKAYGTLDGQVLGATPRFRRCFEFETVKIRNAPSSVINVSINDI